MTLKHPNVLTVLVLIIVAKYFVESAASTVLIMDTFDIGIRLEGYKIVELFDNMTLRECARRCTYVTNCLSFNYGIFNRLCELNSENKHTVDVSNFVTNASYLSLDIASWPQLPSDPCSSKPCSGSDRCLPDRASFICLSSDCASPDEISNDATLAPGSNSLGSVRTYVCPSGQEVAGNSNITCSLSGWSSPNFTCEYLCNDPVASLNDAQVTSGGNSQGSERSYICPSGRLMVGNNVITCVGTDWTTPSFECEYLCNNPVASLNDAQVTSGGNNQGSERSYICPSDRILDGNNVITCVGMDWTTPSFSCNYVRSCADLQGCGASYSDGEYWLYPISLGTTPVKIYCYQMDTSAPTEYVSVTSSTNFGKNGAADANKEVTRNFNKIRIDIETMVVNRLDHTFSVKTGAGTKAVHYGQASDCECESWCSPTLGQFSINTTDTGLLVEPSLTWAAFGYYPKIHNFTRIPSGLEITAECGGYCGHCEPDGDIVLIAQTDFVRNITQAETPNCA